MQFRVVWDQMEECPYLPGQVARLPLRLPTTHLTPAEFDRRLALGERRTGKMLYRTQCPACTACEPLRIPVGAFTPTASQRRVLRRNDSEVRLEIGPCAYTHAGLHLYNRHKQERGLSRNAEPLTATGYRAWLVDSCVETSEVRYYVGARLIAVSVLDFGKTSASSVYHYFDPDESRRSIGVYSVLREIALCADRGLEWYYLGFYVRDCSHLAYKGGYYPHQRLVGGVWTNVTQPPSGGHTDELR